ncbi:DUF3253 domain-containing protein [Phenylobacterium sp.]|uniref:DUF3253 domain-containing protein n=1 Tax=Phenylobacterium sp. TaxID=1871053 RepID=UPI00356967F0
MSADVEGAIFELLAAKIAPGKSISPEEVARRVDPEGWRRLLGHVRAVARGLARQGKLVILRHNKPADPEDFKGVYRLRLPDAETPAEGDAS